MSADDYQAFLARKAAVAPKRGLETLPPLSGSLKPQAVRYLEAQDRQDDLFAREVAA